MSRSGGSGNVRLCSARAWTRAGSRELVRAHGGRLRVEDAPGGGAAFRVELPRAEGPEAG